MQIDSQNLVGIIADEVYLREVIDLQKEFAERLKTTSGIQPEMVVSQLLQNILFYDDEVIEASLGQFGKKLKRFAQDVDFSHPDLARILGGAFSDVSQFSQECNELLLLGEFAKKQSLEIVLPSLNKIITKDDVHKRIWRSVDSPYKNRLHVRLLPDRDSREEVRLMKRAQVLNLDSVYRRGLEFWTALPISFKRFLRFDETYKEEIERVKRKAKRYRDLGCSILSKEIECGIKDYEQQVEDSYYGFNRITMTTSAVILAKSLGHKLVKIGSFLYSSENEYQIEVDRKFFGNYNFDPSQRDIWENKINTPLYARRAEPFIYAPRVYPLHEFLDLAPLNVLETINHLENFPEAGGKPIFDHFGIIVPGIEFPCEKNENHAFLNEDGKYQEYEKIEDARKALDTIFVGKGYFHPVILGEKDNKCYFISYFA